MTAIDRGTIALELSDEFPGLQLMSLRVTGGDAKTPRAVRQRLATLSNRFRVATVPALRQSGIPSAYRAFYRQVGVDPDVVRSPMDAAIHQRLHDGGFLAKGLLYDAVVIATLETLVPIWAIDGAGVVGGLGIRGAEQGEIVAGPEGDVQLTPGQLVIADANEPLIALLAPPGDVRRVTRQSTSMILYCVRVPGVPQTTVEEALTVCADMISEG